MRPASNRGASASIIRKRSHSSASPPAVGYSRTGVPISPQRTRWISRPSRSLCQRPLSRPMSGIPSRGRGLSGVGRAPALDRLPEVLGEALPLVLREQRLDLDAHRLARALAGEVVARHLVEVGQMLATEVLEARRVEALAREPRVAGDLLAVGEFLARQRVERLPIEVLAEAALRGGAEQRPAQLGD